MKKTVNVLFLILLIVTSCEVSSDGGKIKGVVVDRLTKTPIEDVNVKAFTKINIEEDLKYQEHSNKTNSKGEFLIKNLSPKYKYFVGAEKEGYFSTLTYSLYKGVAPPENNQTRILENKLELLKKVPIKGTVIDEFTDSPIEDARVTTKCEPPGYLNASVEKDSIAPNVEVRTDSNGEFTISPIHPESNCEFTISKPGHSTLNMKYSTNNEADQPKKPFVIKKFPPPGGVYALVNQEVVPITKTSDGKTKVAPVRSIGGGLSSSFLYIKLEDLRTIQKFNEGTIKKILFTTDEDRDEYSYKYFFYETYFYEKLVTAFNRDEPVEYLNDKNVFVCLRRNNEALRTFENKFNFRNEGHGEIFSADGYPKKLMVGGLPTTHWSDRFTTKEKGIKPGVYAINTPKETYFFEIVNGKSTVSNLLNKYEN